MGGFCVEALKGEWLGVVSNEAKGRDGGNGGFVAT
jgi:hypothetical protein